MEKCVFSSWFWGKMEQSVDRKRDKKWFPLILKSMYFVSNMKGRIGPTGRGRWRVFFCPKAEDVVVSRVIGVFYFFLLRWYFNTLRNGKRSVRTRWRISRKLLLIRLFVLLDTKKKTVTVIIFLFISINYRRGFCSCIVILIGT